MLSKKEAQKIEKIKIDYKDVTMFMHCKKCLPKFLKSKEYKNGLMSPCEAMKEELGSMPLKFPDGTTSYIVVVFCGLCKTLIWDSRHLTHLY